MNGWTNERVLTFSCFHSYTYTRIYPEKMLYSPRKTNIHMNNHRLFIYAAIFAAFLFLGPRAVLAAPVVGTVSYPSNIEAGDPATISASVSSGVPIQYCNLYVDNDDKGAMTVSGGMASKAYSFSYSQVYTVFVFCKDTSGGMGKSASAAVWVKVGPTPPSEPFGGAQPDPDPEPEPDPELIDEPASEDVVLEAGNLIKLECSEGAGPNDPCTAVYYYGADEKRHAFPNAKVYFTWYENFDSVVTISIEQMGSVMLGANVTYRPGVRMVKFTTVNRVYALSKGGVLRWVTTEEVATALYGEDWNAKIDDIPDTFYMNYAFGDDIGTAEGYGVTSEMESAPTIDDSLAAAPEACQTCHV